VVGHGVRLSVPGSRRPRGVSRGAHLACCAGRNKTGSMRNFFHIISGFVRTRKLSAGCNFWKSMIAPAHSEDERGRFQGTDRRRGAPVAPEAATGVAVAGRGGAAGGGVLAALAAWGLDRSGIRGLVRGLRGVGGGDPGGAVCKGTDGAFRLAEPGTAAMAFFLWEMVKLGVSVFLLALAPRLGMPAELAGHAGGSGADDEGILGGDAVGAQGK
jgi:hypothetical protein